MGTRLLMVVLLLLLIGTFAAADDDKPASVSDAREAIEANLRTTEGKAYDQQMGKEFAEKYLDTRKRCKESAGNDLGSFWMLLKLDKDGAVNEALLYPRQRWAAARVRQSHLFEGIMSATESHRGS